MNEIVKDIINEPIYQPKLGTYIFYGKGNLELIDICISNKLPLTTKLSRIINH